ncbi:hypothetical protein CRUP_032888, partial [Coryphaenoides rupestris]
MSNPGTRRNGSSIKIRLTVLCAKNLAKKDFFRLPDPFAKVVVDGSGQCHSTDTVKSTLDPKWNQHYDLYIGKTDSITISVWNHKKIHKRQGAGFLGCIRLLSNAISRLKDTGYQRLDLCKLNPSDSDAVRGQIVVSLQTRDRIGSGGPVVDCRGLLENEGQEGRLQTQRIRGQEPRGHGGLTPQNRPHGHQSPDLPEGYEQRTTVQGQVYFLHTQTGVSTWHDPRIPSTVSGRIYFVDHNNRTTQFTDPRLHTIIRAEVEAAVEADKAAVAGMAVRYERDLVHKLKLLRHELSLQQPQAGHCRIEVSRQEIFEWLYLLCHEMLNPYYGLFQYSTDNIYTLQINPDSSINPNDITSVLDHTFCVEHSAFGKFLQHELKPNGRNVPVTEDNKKEYVRLYVNWRFMRGIEAQFLALQKGFSELIPQHLLKPFDHKELEANTRLKHCTCDSSVVRWFWQAVEAFSEERRGRLLQFVTGSTRVPLQGFKALQ